MKTLIVSMLVFGAFISYAGDGGSCCSKKNAKACSTEMKDAKAATTPTVAPANTTAAVVNTTPQVVTAPITTKVSANTVKKSK